MENMNVPYKTLALTAMLLFIAIAPLPYGYYTFARIIVCGCSGIMCYQLCKAKDRGSWPWVWGTVAILFNPVVNIYMSKEAWMAMDAATGVLFSYAANIQLSDLKKQIFT